MHIYDFTIRLGAGTEEDPHRFTTIDITARNWKEAALKISPSTQVVGMVRRGAAVVRPVTEVDDQEWQ